METTTNIYFGYGSNLDYADFQSWGEQRKLKIGKFKELSVGVLMDHILLFNYFSKSRQCGVANVLQSKYDIVPGVFFEVDDITKTALDKKEGHPNFYRRFETEAFSPTLGFIRCFTYSVIPEKQLTDEVKPSAEYLNLIKKNLTKRSLPTRHLLNIENHHAFLRSPKNVFVSAADFSKVGGYLGTNDPDQKISLKPGKALITKKLFSKQNTETLGEVGNTEGVNTRTSPEEPSNNVANPSGQTGSLPELKEGELVSTQGMVISANSYPLGHFLFDLIEEKLKPYGELKSAVVSLCEDPGNVNPDSTESVSPDAYVYTFLTLPGKEKTDAG